MKNLLKNSTIVKEIPSESHEAKLIKSWNLGIVSDDSTVDAELYEIYSCEFRYEDGETFEETYAIRVEEEI